MPCQQQTNYPSQCEQAVNELIAAYNDAEVAYLTAAANAIYEQIGRLPNLTRYLRARAHVIFFRRAALVCYQTSRGAAVSMVAPTNPAPRNKPVTTVQEFIQQVLKQLVEAERHLEQGWRNLLQTAQQQNDPDATVFAKKDFDTGKALIVPQATQIYKCFVQAKCPFTYDAIEMKEAAEEQEERAKRLMNMECNQSQQFLQY